MFGILLVSFGTLIAEVGNTIGKKEVLKHRESVLGMGFLNGLWATIFLLLIVFAVPSGFLPAGISSDYVFDPASLPTFLVRVALELVIIHLILEGVARASRTTFTFLRMVTIPLLLIVDLALGYSIGLLEISGIAIIIFTTIYLVASSTLEKAGMWYVLSAAVLAVATISLYQYHITTFNSVAGEQLTISLILVTYLFCATVYKTKKNPLRHLKRPKVFLQSLSVGLGSVFVSFAFLFAASSVITAAKRTSSVLWSIISGNIYFHEKKFVLKMHAFLILVVGLFLLT